MKLSELTQELNTLGISIGSQAEPELEVQLTDGKRVKIAKFSIDVEGTRLRLILHLHKPRVRKERVKLAEGNKLEMES